MVNVLDECFDAFTNFPFAHLLTLFLSPRDFITRQRFPKHSDERSVAGKENSVRRFILFASRGKIQTDQGLSRTRHTSDKTDPFAFFALSFVYQFLDASRRDVQILRACVEPRDSFD